MYKVVARNKIGQTVAHTRVVEGMIPDPPDAVEASQISDTEILLTWHPPRCDGNTPIICYSLKYKKGDADDWINIANNIDHEFFYIRSLEPNTSYDFRLASKNAIGWSEFGIPTLSVKTLEVGAPKIQMSRTMLHLQQITDSGQEVMPEITIKPNYALEQEPIQWITDADVQDHYKFISEIHK